ncbi:MAG: pilus assembly protein N-terminal domain-containing protein [Rhodobacteraceae bacterium]|nr:pilus assembly protein N-terminal domain-containing protein [Paracoccaceae bacterium]
MAGLIFTLTSPLALPATAETLSVFRGDIETAIYVPIGDQAFLVIPNSFCEMAVADPDIADIASLTSRLARVDGIAAGRTSLAIFDCEGGTISIVEILVAPHANTANVTGPFYVPEMLSGEQIPVIKNIAAATLRLPASVAVIVKTDLPAVDFDMDDLDVADAAHLGDTRFYILGKTVGTTTMYLQHEDGSAPTILNIEIVGNNDSNS